MASRRAQASPVLARQPALLDVPENPTGGWQQCTCTVMVLREDAVTSEGHWGSLPRLLPGMLKLGQLLLLCPWERVLSLCEGLLMCIACIHYATASGTASARNLMAESSVTGPPIIQT